MVGAEVVAGEGEGVAAGAGEGVGETEGENEGEVEGGRIEAMWEIHLLRIHCLSGHSQRHA